MRRWLMVCVLWVIGVSVVAAQTATDRALVLSVVDGELSAGEIFTNGGSLYVDYNPQDSTRYARVDGIGLLRFAPLGGNEGVYTFAPFFDGYTADSTTANKLWVREAKWSPNGQQVAFWIANPAITDAAHGVWFWQPARELATDPAYQLLRVCPPYCELTSALASDAWEVRGLEWSSDNVGVLIALFLPNENRTAFTVRTASRNNEQTTTRPNIVRYDTASWASDGQRLIVSGRDPNGLVVFGSVDRSGENAIITPASEIGMNWVQNAVQERATGRIVMLGSSVNQFSPLQLVDSSGVVMTEPIGANLPSVVDWNADNSAVRLVVDGRTYIATLTGAVYDITSLVASTPNVGWVTGRLPSTTRLLSVPEPLTLTPTATPTVTATTLNPSAYAVGQLLQVSVAQVVMYAEPITDAVVVQTLVAGEELIITGGPVDDGVNRWWRVQTLAYSGWITETVDGLPTMGPVNDAG